MARARRGFWHGRRPHAPRRLVFCLHMGHWRLLCCSASVRQSLLCVGGHATGGGRRAFRRAPGPNNARLLSHAPAEVVVTLQLAHGVVHQAQAAREEGRGRAHAQQVWAQSGAHRQACGCAPDGALQLVLERLQRVREGREVSARGRHDGSRKARTQCQRGRLRLRRPALYRPHHRSGSVTDHSSRSGAVIQGVRTEGTDRQHRCPGGLRHRVRVC